MGWGLFLESVLSGTVFAVHIGNLVWFDYLSDVILNKAL